MSSQFRSPAAHAWTAFAVALALIPAVALAAPSADPTYAALRAARPDGRTVPVNGLVLERDVFRFQFDSGAFHFLAPVAGRTVGAVFVGRGSYRLSPATENERRQLALSSGAGSGFETLTDDFDDLVLLFADDTAQEIELHASARAGTPDPRAAEVQERYLKRQRKDFRTNFQARLLRDLLNSPGLMSGVFLSLIDGKQYPPALAAVDPDGSEALGISIRLGSEDTVFVVADPNRGGLWYHCDRQAEVERKRKSPEKRLTDALDYTVDTRVEKNEDLAGTTTIRFKTLVPNLRVLPLFLEPSLRIKEAAFAVDAGDAEASWKPVAFVQEAREGGRRRRGRFPRGAGQRRDGPVAARLQRREGARGWWRQELLRWRPGKLVPERGSLLRSRRLRPDLSRSRRQRNHFGGKARGRENRERAERFAMANGASRSSRGLQLRQVQEAGQAGRVQ